MMTVRSSLHSSQYLRCHKHVIFYVFATTNDVYSWLSLHQLQQNPECTQ